MDYEYEVVAEGGLSELQAAVKVYLIEGWMCQGGVAVVRAEYPDLLHGGTEVCYMYYQAMIRVTTP